MARPAPALLGVWLALNLGVTVSLGISDGQALVQGSMEIRGHRSWRDAEDEEEESSDKASSGRAQAEVIRAMDEDFEDATEPTKYLIDNSELKHRGPGVLYRLSKDLSHIGPKEEYAMWGSTVEGIDEGDGWIKVSSQYLPTKVKGVPVITAQEVVRPRMRIAYRGTEVKAPDNNWIPCSISSRGTKTDAYNIKVTPRSNFASYSVSNVPSSMLKRVLKTKEPMPTTMRTRLAAPVKDNAFHKSAEGFVRVKVDDGNGEVIEAKVLRRSPFRALQRVICEHYHISKFECDTNTLFTWKGRQLDAEEIVNAIGLWDGATLEMTRGKAPEKAVPVQ